MGCRPSVDGKERVSGMPVRSVFGAGNPFPDYRCGTRSVQASRKHMTCTSEGMYNSPVQSISFGMIAKPLDAHGKIHFTLFPVTRSHRAERKDASTMPAYSSDSFRWQKSLFIGRSLRHTTVCSPSSPGPGMVSLTGATLSVRGACLYTCATTWTVH